MGITTNPHKKNDTRHKYSFLSCALVLLFGLLNRMELYKREVVYFNDKKEKKTEYIETFKKQIDFAIAEINDELEKIEEFWDIIGIKRID